jgi:prepilin-type N-terminal cleavage/methylation domain-containing protein
MMRKRLNNQKGFTLVEIIAVLILLGILAAVAAPKYFDLTANAEIRALDAAGAVLNGRENMVWANTMLSATGYDAATSDGTIRTTVTTDSLGDFSWDAGPTDDGGTLNYNGTTRVLTRTHSDATTPGKWQ